MYKAYDLGSVLKEFTVLARLNTSVRMNAGSFDVNS